MAGQHSQQPEQARPLQRPHVKCRVRNFLAVQRILPRENSRFPNLLFVLRCLQAYPIHPSGSVMPARLVVAETSFHDEKNF